ncbi:PhoPQ-activated pathogenicity-related family protein [Candidatus Sumerlaeota bacterium]|nr:PhoPQ-activated pathogenicity-related family protein [Candidatus Sumerlaeota bacterium]
MRAEETALDRYIAKADPSYQWKLLNVIPGEGCKTFVVELTSQTWRSEKDVNRPLWKHWLTVVKPDGVTSDTAFLTIGGGDNKSAPPKGPSDKTLALAMDSRTVVAELGMVPNQPLYFTDSKDRGRSEDDIIAYSRIKFSETGDETWLVRLAMVKSAVRAMDCIQELMRSQQGGKLRIEKFVVSGGSKRGWTTWLTGIEDKRVIAIIPIVIDALNSEEITRHHFEAYGYFSPALNDYVEHGIFPDKIGTPGYQAALRIEDAYHYFDREQIAKNPKYIVNASGDEFFLPDNSHFYWNRIPGEKYLRYVPNAKHSLAGSDARESISAFYQSILSGRPRPQYTWRKGTDGTLVVETQQKPREVNLWQATNPNARDFRLDVIGKAYAKTALQETRKGVYTVRVPKPEKGYTAYFVELVYDSGGKYPFKFTTEVSIVPDILPHKWAEALTMPKDQLIKR